MGSAGVPRLRPVHVAGVLAAVLAAAPCPGGSASTGVSGGVPSRVPDPMLRARIDEARLRAAVRFEPNVGQTAPQVRWLARARDGMLFLTDREAVLSFGGPAPRAPAGAPVSATGRDRFAAGGGGGVLRMEFVGAAEAPRYEASAPLPGVANYFLGNDPSKWRSGVPNYGAVTVRDLWPGVGLRFRGDPIRMEYDLLVAPGADPEAARFRFAGQTAMRLEESGDLVLSLAGGEVRQSVPVLWQEEAGGARVPVAGGFRIRGDGTVGFRVGARDPRLPLVVDPKIDWSTYLGGNTFEIAYDIAVTSGGNPVVAGYTSSTNFPLQSPSLQTTFAGVYDVFVTKYAANLASIAFSTYLGGAGSEAALGMSIDGSGSILLAGRTASTNFPTASAFQSAHAGGTNDMFVAKLSSTGASLTYSTYVGTSADDEARDVAADSSGNAIVVGGTGSSSFPLASAIQSSYGGGSWDVAAFSLNSSGNGLNWSTLYGGALTDYAFSVALDPGGGIYVGGNTTSTDFPTKSPLQGTFGGGTGTFPSDSFLMKIAAGGTSLAYATYLGGSEYEDCYRVAVNSSGEAYLAGDTGSANFPVGNAYQSSRSGAPDAFLTKVNAAGSAILWSTYVGGGSPDTAFGLCLDSQGAPVVCGLSQSADFPLINAFHTTFQGSANNDGWIARFSGSGGIPRFCSYISSNGYDEAYSVAVDPNDDPVACGVTSSASFPTANPVQGTYAGGNSDNYVLRIVLVLPAAPTSLAAQTAGQAPINLTWVDGSTDETGFEVERRSGAGVFAKIGSTLPAGTVSYADTAVGPATTYTYRVRAVNGDGASGYSNEASAATLDVSTVPQVPINLVATPISTSSIGITFIDVSANETSFVVQRREEDGEFGQAKILSAQSAPNGTVAWTDNGRDAGTLYTYQVRSVGSAGVSAWSAEASATSLPTMSVTSAKGTITDSAKAKKDKLKVAGTFDFLSDSPDAAIDPAVEGVSVYLVGTASPLVLTVDPGAAGWKSKKGKFTWKSPKGSPLGVSIVLDTAKKTFAITVSKFSLPAPAANPVRVTIKCGDDAGTHSADWTPKKPGVFKFP